MGIQLKAGNLYSFFAVLIIVCIIATATTAASASVEENTDPSCNNGTIADCIHDDINGEPDEVNRRSLQVRGRKISYRALERPPICNANIYGNCLSPSGPNVRPCSYYVRCRRATS